MPVTAGQRNHVLARCKPARTGCVKIKIWMIRDERSYECARTSSAAETFFYEGNPFLISRIISHNIWVFYRTSLGKCVRVALLETGSELFSFFARDAFVIFPHFHNNEIHSFMNSWWLRSGFVIVSQHSLSFKRGITDKTNTHCNIPSSFEIFEITTLKFLPT